MARRKGYGQFCPVAKAAEIVAERWTLLVLREISSGSHRFNELRRGVPLMSPSLLSQRLRELEDGGVVERRVDGDGPPTYHLTAAGRELEPIINLLGLWGHRWAQAQLRRDDLDPSLLMWELRRRCDASAFPPDRRTVVYFDIGGVPSAKSRWWLVFEAGEADLCFKDPGYPVDLRVEAHVRTLVDLWWGRVEVAAALRAGELRLTGSREQQRRFPTWFGYSVFIRMEAEAATPSRTETASRPAAR